MTAENSSQRSGPEALKPEEELRAGRSPLKDAWRQLLRNRLAVASGIFLILLTLVAIFVDTSFFTIFTGGEPEPLLAPYHYAEVDFLHPNEGLFTRTEEGDFYIFGVDYLGRDILSRTLYAARVSLAVAIVAATVSLIVGITYGLISGYSSTRIDNLMMRFGALYNQELGGPFVVPLVFVDWHFAGRWSLTGMLPIYAKVQYQANDNFSTGLAFFGLITSYKLGHPAYAGDYMERTSIDPALFARLRVAGNLHLEGRLGYAINRKYVQYAADQTVPFRISIISFGDDRVARNVTFGSGMFASLRLVYNMPLGNNEK